MCFLSSLFMFFYNVGKTRNVEPTLGQNKERKKQRPLPNRECVTIVRTQSSVMSQHVDFPELSGEAESESSLTLNIFSNLCFSLLAQPNLTHHPLSLAFCTSRDFPVPELVGGRGRPKPRSSSSQPCAHSSMLPPGICCHY